mgnify:CR=1 FL=1
MKTCCDCKTQKEISEFHKRASRCKVCAIAYAAEWAKNNPEKVKQAQRKHASKNKEENRERLLSWRQANPEKAKAQWERSNEKRKAARIKVEKRSDEERKELAKIRRNKWSAKNKSYVASRLADRRAKKHAATVSWANKFFISEAYALAKLREKLVGGKWHVDHIVPLRNKLVCGLHVESNLQVIPAEQNYRKSNTFWPDMPV